MPSQSLCRSILRPVRSDVSMFLHEMSVPPDFHRHASKPHAKPYPSGILGLNPCSRSSPHLLHTPYNSPKSYLFFSCLQPKPFPNPTQCLPTSASPLPAEAAHQVMSSATSPTSALGTLPPHHRTAPTRKTVSCKTISIGSGSPISRF